MQTIIAFETQGFVIGVYKWNEFYFVGSTYKQPLPCIGLTHALDVFDFCMEQFGNGWVN